MYFFVEWLHFFQKNKALRFLLKPDDVIKCTQVEMLTKVHFMISMFYSTDHQGKKLHSAKVRR